MNLQRLVNKCHDNADRKGFWEDFKQYRNCEDQKYITTTFLALMMTEVAEMEDATTDENFAEELADICIRIFDFFGGLQLDITVDAAYSENRTIYWHIAQAIECLRKDDMPSVEKWLKAAYYRTRLKAEDNGVDLEQAIKDKMEVNRGRKYKHGKEF